MKSRADRVVAAVVCVALLPALAASCRQKMADQPKYKPLAASDFFPDHRASRPLLPGTVARGHLREDSLLYTGKVDGELADAFPFPVSREVLDRGRERYEIFCSPCHSRVGDGRGMVVRRGFPPAQSFHIDRLREAKAGYFFDVITNGFGRMQGYAAQIPAEDRWAIIVYVRALQLSHHARLEDVPPESRADLFRERSR